MNTINTIADSLKKAVNLDILFVSKDDIKNDKCNKIKLYNSDFYMYISKNSSYNTIYFIKQILENFLIQYKECNYNKEYIAYFKTAINELLDASKSYANEGYIEAKSFTFLNEKINYCIVKDDVVLYNRNIDSITLVTSILKLKKQDEFSMFVRKGEVYGCSVQHYKTILSCDSEIEDIIKNAIKVRLVFLNKLYENELYLAELKNINFALEEAVTERTKEIENKNIMLEEEKNKLNEANLKLIEVNKKLHDLSRTDSLTMLSNRRDIQEKFYIEVNKSKIKQMPISLIMCDVDLFKSINDRFGHECGDQVLVKIADLFSNNLREKDHISRYGGEEFVIILPEADFAYSNIVAEKLRSILEAEIFEYEGEQFHVTMSFGLCSFFHEINFSECIRQADLSLYKAKNEGRNKVVSIQL